MTALYDYGRADRIGLPEAILCEGKSDDALQALIEELLSAAQSPVLLTRLTEPRAARLQREFGGRLDYDRVSATAFLNGCLPALDARVAVVAGGTSDLPVAAEAARTLEFLGILAERFVDVGVAGLWRLQERMPRIGEAAVVIVIAGMDAALATVVAGLTPKPVIGVPTSVGYGVAAGGHTALHAMLASCAQGVLVANIDNGFGAACAAARMIKSMGKPNG